MISPDGILKGGVKQIELITRPSYFKLDAIVTHLSAFVVESLIIYRRLLNFEYLLRHLPDVVVNINVLGDYPAGYLFRLPGLPDRCYHPTGKRHTSEFTSQHFVHQAHLS